MQIKGYSTSNLQSVIIDIKISLKVKKFHDAKEFARRPKHYSLAAILIDIGI